MIPLIELIAERHGDVMLATLRGEVDASNAATLRAELERLLSNRSMALVVDLSAVGYLDSAGINLLFALGAGLRERQQRLHLVVEEGSPIERMLTISGLRATETTHRARAVALSAAAGA